MIQFYSHLEYRTLLAPAPIVVTVLFVCMCFQVSPWVRILYSPPSQGAFFGETLRNGFLFSASIREKNLFSLLLRPSALLSSRPLPSDIGWHLASPQTAFGRGVSRPQPPGSSTPHTLQRPTQTQHDRPDILNAPHGSSLLTAVGSPTNTYPSCFSWQRLLCWARPCGIPSHDVAAGLDCFSTALPPDGTHAGPRRISCLPCIFLSRASLVGLNILASPASSAHPGTSCWPHPWCFTRQTPSNAANT